MNKRGGKILVLMALASAVTMNFYAQGGVPPVDPPMGFEVSNPYQVKVEAGEAFTLAATFQVPLSASMTMRWLRDGEVVSTVSTGGRTTVATFRKEAAKVADTGTYRAEAVWSEGVMQSPAYSVVVQPAQAPAITSEPFLSGGTLLMVAAEGKGTLSYQWLREGVAIAGATGTYYSVPDQAGVAGTYRVEVKNAGGTTRSQDVIVPVRVKPPNIIDPQPLSADLMVGDPLQLTASANYTSVRWQKDGRDIPGLSYVLQIESVTAADAGRYRVFFTTDAGTLISEEAVVTVTTPSGPPRITRHPQGDSVNGYDITLTVELEAGTAPVTYQWRREGVPLAGATTAKLVLPYAASTTRGSFDVVVSGSGGATTSEPAVIIANAGALILGMAPSVAARLSSTVILQPTVPGFSSARYEWRKDGVVVSTSPFSKDLYLIGLKATNFGVYTLTATRGTEVQSATVTVADLDTGRQPRFFRHPKNVSPWSSYQTEGTMLILTCEVRGQAPLSLQWMRDGVPVAGATAQELHIEKMAATDGGRYRLRATNAAGTTDSREAVVTLWPTVPPSFELQPVSARAAAGNPFSMSGYAGAAGTNVYQWYLNNQPIAGATAAYFTQPLAHPRDVGRYRLHATNIAGDAWSEEATFSLLPWGGAPQITAGLTDVVVPTAGFITLAVGANASDLGLRYEWRKNGQLLPNASGPTLQIAAAEAADEGTYAVTVANSFGSATTSAKVTVTPGEVPAGAPVFLSMPPNLTVTTGGTGTFTVQVAGKPAPTLQWRRDGVAIPGATGPTLTVVGVTAASEGKYSVVATNGQGTAQTMPAQLTVATVRGRLTNLSVRATLAAGGNLLAGFVTTGGGSPALLVRAAGPALKGFGVADAVADPKLRLRDSRGEVVAENDNWDGGAALVAATAAAGAFPFVVGAKDAALLNSLATGAYTAEITDVRGTAGSTLAEVYAAEIGAGARLANLSCRLKSGPGAEIVTVGFVVEGGPLRVLIRGIGPTLRWFGVEGAMSDPKIRVFSGQTVMMSVDNWGGEATVTEAASQTGAFPLSRVSRDAAVVMGLAPGPYTVQISGVDGSAGEVLAEIYEVLPAPATPLGGADVRPSNN